MSMQRQPSMMRQGSMTKAASIRRRASDGALGLKSGRDGAGGSMLPHHEESAEEGAEGLEEEGESSFSMMMDYLKRQAAHVSVCICVCTSQLCVIVCGVCFKRQAAHASTCVL